MDPLPAPNLKPDDPSAAEPARLRLARKNGFFKTFSLTNLRKPTSNVDRRDLEGNDSELDLGNDDQQFFDSVFSSAPSVLLDESSFVGDSLSNHKDVYGWAVVYENQRGMTFFSIPYYSPLSLLPNDPPPFTLPEGDGYNNRQPQASLTEYPLPDGTWRWVSKSWMVDMRDAGEVQYDGFEYNWFFRKHNWRAEVGTLSAGGWVRRRRWVRLMMRPAKPVTDEGYDSEEASRPSSHPSSVREIDPDGAKRVQSVWKGDGGDWERCCSCMRQLLRDGKKLELWKEWLGINDVVENGRGKGKQRTEDASPLPSQAARDELVSEQLSSNEPPPAEFIARVTSEHAQEILNFFIYPESRAQFLGLARKAGLLTDLGPASVSLSTQAVDFWSYTRSFDDSFVERPSRIEYARSLGQSWDFRISVHVPLSLSLGPALLSFISSPRARRSKGFLTGLKSVLRRELGVTGFSFAITVAIGGGSALQHLWKRIEDDAHDAELCSKHCGRFARRFHVLRAYLSSISEEGKAFALNALSSFVAIMLLQAHRRSSQTRKAAIPWTIPISPPPKNALGRSSATLDLTLLLIVRALDAVVQKVVFRRGGDEGEEARRWRQRVTTKLDALMFWASSARITSMANVDTRLIAGLRAIKSGEWSYVDGSRPNPNILSSLSQALGYPPSWGDPACLPAYGGPAATVSWRELGVRGRDGLGGLPCEIVHGTVTGGSCTTNAATRGLHALLEAFVIYLPVHFLPILLTHPHALLRPQKLLQTLLGVLRSASFLSTFVSSIWTAVCLTRTLLVARLLPNISHDFYDGPFGCVMAGCLACGSSIWIENGRRRGEMALYVLPRAIRACLPDRWVRSGSRSVYAIERIAFTLSLALLLTEGVYRPECTRGLARWTLSFVLNGPNAGLWKPKRQDNFADPPQS
ncbi:hypothetical protein EW146_g3828 [Bondarzewia mesenterica]|uniref:TECPR1-like DysF domain-containing protein n=1 Tax=Bondarzewia mesenterica TaxID=1095465 RepID=A0A4S4LY91_9AGAM|nr:hypothetical protein EW146_g3828 [Bondarzewia mesenterica]